MRRTASPLGWVSGGIMTWDAIGALAELVGALAVLLTLGYLAIQVKHAQYSMADQNRLERSRAVREMIFTVVGNPQLAKDQMKDLGLEDYYEALAEELGLTPERAIAVEWTNAYYFWMWWGQFTSTTKLDDLEELKHVILGLTDTPGMRRTWDKSPMVKPLLDPKFVEFVETVLAE